MGRRRNKTASRTSPSSSRRACLCKDNTYSRKCCDGSLQAQGIGSLVGEELLCLESGAYLQQENNNNIKV
tara:strand:+ start:742 stop:951 length:210 start_codon:yes stop_codon:yes gene_type:complete